jgi:hypothetical protein
MDLASLQHPLPSMWNRSFIYIDKLTTETIENVSLIHEVCGGISPYAVGIKQSATFLARRTHFRCLKFLQFEDTEPAVLYILYYFFPNNGRVQRKCSRDKFTNP